MPSFIPNQSKKDILEDYFLDENKTFKIGLLQPGFNGLASSVAYYNDLYSSEFSGAGYVRGGLTLENVSVTLSGSSVRVSADDLSRSQGNFWSSLTGDIGGYFIYEDTGSRFTSRVFHVGLYSDTRTPFRGEFEHSIGSDGFYEVN